MYLENFINGNMANVLIPVLLIVFIGLFITVIDDINPKIKDMF
jgi:hypothetical protein